MNVRSCRDRITQGAAAYGSVRNVAKASRLPVSKVK